MFRRSKSAQHIPPAPPTIEQILEDLETFEVERPDIAPIRTLESSDEQTTSPTHGDGVENNADATVADTDTKESKQLDLWWQTFTTFHQDVNELHRRRRRLQLLEADLTDTRDVIATELQDLKRRVESALNVSSEN